MAARMSCHRITAVATILSITPNPLLDFLATGTITPGKTTRVTAFTSIAGGKGVNMARVLARHGHRSIAAGFLGSGHESRFAQLLADDGIENAFTPVAAPARIGFQVCDANRSRSTAVLESGFAVSAAEIRSFFRQFRNQASRVDLVIVGGSVPSPSCLQLIKHICDICAQLRTPCWVDSYGPAMDVALAGPHPPLVAKPNHDEYGRSRAWLGCRELHLTDGAKPIKIRCPEGFFRVVPPAVNEINPIGSGDCYLAALAHARLSNWALTTQFAYAAAAGAANACQPDVAHIHPQDIAKLAKKSVVIANKK